MKLKNHDCLNITPANILHVGIYKNQKQRKLLFAFFKLQSLIIWFSEYFVKY